LLQGKEGQAKEECALLGSFTLNNLPPISDLTPRIEIAFQLDINGMLTAKALDLISGKSQELQVAVHLEDEEAA